MSEKQTGDLGRDPESSAAGAMADDLLQKASMAAAVFQQFDQAQTDDIVARVCRAGFDRRVALAKMACAETGLGVWEHKVIKNVIATQFVHESIRREKTVGVLSVDEVSGITEIAQPLGPVLAVIPVTNPTSTVLFKILICLKTRNPIIVSPTNTGRQSPNSIMLTPDRSAISRRIWRRIWRRRPIMSRTGPQGPSAPSAGPPDAPAARPDPPHTSHRPNETAPAADRRKTARPSRSDRG